MKISINKLSELTGVDRRRVKRCVKDLEHTVEGRSHLYESTEAIPALYFTPAYDDSLDLTQERARLAHFQANKADLETQVMTGELISVEEVAEIIGNDYANVRAKLLAFPSKVASELHGLDPDAIRAALDDHIRDALLELSTDLGDSSNDEIKIGTI